MPELLAVAFVMASTFVLGYAVRAVLDRPEPQPRPKPQLEPAGRHRRQYVAPRPDVRQLVRVAPDTERGISLPATLRVPVRRAA